VGHLCDGGRVKLEGKTSPEEVVFTKVQGCQGENCSLVRDGVQWKFVSRLFAMYLKGGELFWSFELNQEALEESVGVRGGKKNGLWTGSK